MKAKYFKILTAFILLFICAANNASAQNIFPATGSAGIGTASPNASALLEMVSTSKGLLIPRMTLAQRNVIATPATGLMIYQTNSTPGFYYYSGNAWTAITPKSKGWALTGNAGTSPAVNFIGTTDAQPLLFKVNNQLSASLDYSSAANTSFGYKTLVSNTNFNNTAFGYQALFSNTTGGYNTAVGTYSLLNNTLGYQNTAIGSNSLQSNQSGNYNAALGYGALLNNTTGSSNVAIGNTALLKNVSGSGNIAIGDVALYNNTTTNENIAIGNYSLYANTTGYSNTATGHYALQANTTGNNNTANGNSALFANTTGNSNSAFGVGALSSNTTGYKNTANGYNALFSNTTGVNNTANGDEALFSNKDGNINTATGYQALYSNTTGGANTANGYAALFYNTAGGTNTAMGEYALFNNTTGYGNTAIGTTALFSNKTGSFNTVIGWEAGYSSDTYRYSAAFGIDADMSASNQIRIGSVGQTVDPTSIGGKVSWSTLSDGRVKKNIKENVPGLIFINQLKPITYNIDNDAVNKIIQHPPIKDKNRNDITRSADEIAAGKANTAIVYTGFLAQEVEKVARSLNYDFSGVDAAKNDKDLYGLRYADFVVPLTKAVQELSKINDEKDKKINEQDKKIDNLQKQIDELKRIVENSVTNIKSGQTLNTVSPSLEQNTPNPYSQATIINYSLPGKFSSAKISVTDNSGKTIKQFMLSSAASGSININAGTLAQGTYVYSLYVDGKFIDSKRMVIAK